MIPMKPSVFLACAVAVLALAGCNKSDDKGSTPAVDDTVKITQANPPPIQASPQAIGRAYLD